LKSFRLIPSKELYQELVAFTSNLVALALILIAFRVELVAFNARLVALSHLLDSHSRKIVEGFIFSKSRLNKQAICR